MEDSTKAVIAFIVLVFAVISYTVWDNQRDKKVLRSESIGIAQTAQFFPSDVSSAKATEITTDKGMFLVNGSFQLIKGDELFMEKRASGRSYICDYKQSLCNTLDKNP